jgi:hypothetical protein
MYPRPPPPLPLNPIPTSSFPNLTLTFPFRDRCSFVPWNSHAHLLHNLLPLRPLPHLDPRHRCTSPLSTAQLSFLAPPPQLLPCCHPDLLGQIKTFLKGDRPAYAIITGPTSGIGKAYAIALAKQGFNLILVSRSASKLAALKDELASASPNIDIRLVSVDIGGSHLSPAYPDMLKDVSQAGGDIRVLVNNAGVSHDIPVTFEDMSVEEMEGIVAVNTCGVLRITKEALPYLLSDRFLLYSP